MLLHSNNRDKVTVTTFKTVSIVPIIANAGANHKARSEAHLMAECQKEADSVFLGDLATGEVSVPEGKDWGGTLIDCFSIVIDCCIVGCNFVMEPTLRQWRTPPQKSSAASSVSPLILPPDTSIGTLTGKKASKRPWAS